MKYLYRISLIFMILTIMSAIVLGGYFVYQTYGEKEESKKIQEQEAVLEAAAGGGTTDCDTEYIILEYHLDSGESQPYVESIPPKYIGKTKGELEEILIQEEKSPTLRERQKGLQSIRLSAFSRERVVIVKSYEAKQDINREDAKDTVSGQSVSGQDMAEDNRRYEAEGISYEDAFENDQEAMETMGSGNKRIEELQDTGNYYLMARDGNVCVYYEDMKTLYLATDILLDHLPDEVRQEVLDKKYIKNEEELYNFLESYSS